VQRLVSTCLRWCRDRARLVALRAGPVDRVSGSEYWALSQAHCRGNPLKGPPDRTVCDIPRTLTLSKRCGAYAHFGMQKAVIYGEYRFRGSR
jgi:hypothetical protein